MKFYNREQELNLLKKIKRLSQKHSQMTVITGRRRVGKTALIQEYIKRSLASGEKDKIFYFFVERKRIEILLEEYFRILQKSYAFLTTPFEKIEQFFDFIFVLVQKENTTIIFDEFQNFKYINSAVFSLLQKRWDLYSQKTKLNLILIGSIVSLMEKIFGGSKEPLFGRANHKIYLKPFSPSLVGSIIQDFGKTQFTDLVDFYTVFGGIPKYYVEIENQELFAEEKFIDLIDKLFLVNNAPLRREGTDILSEEFGRNHQLYFSIIELVAGGVNRVSEIASKLHLPATSLARYLDRLVKFYRILKRKSSIFGQRSKLNIYELEDNFLRFWFRYIASHQSLIEAGYRQRVKHFIQKDFSILKGSVFEDMVRDYLIGQDQASNFFFPIDEIGNFWNRKGIEIDLVGYNKKEKAIFFGECKLNACRISLETLNRLREKAKSVAWNLDKRIEYFGLFAIGKIGVSLKKNLLKQKVLIKEF